MTTEEILGKLVSAGLQVRPLFSPAGTVIQIRIGWSNSAFVSRVPLDEEIHERFVEALISEEKRRREQQQEFVSGPSAEVA